MFFRQLQYLTALAQEEHFGRAAARCNVSQPSLSSAIKQLELTLGVPIVLRGRRFLGFTSEGQKIIEWAERVISQRDAMLVELSGMRENFEGRLRLDQWQDKEGNNRSKMKVVVEGFQFIDSGSGGQGDPQGDQGTRMQAPAGAAAGVHQPVDEADIPF